MREPIYLTLRESEIPTLAEQVARMVCDQLRPLLSQKPQRDPDELVNRKEAAVILRVSPSSVSRYADDGWIPKHRAGRRVLFKVGELREFVQRRNV